MAENNGCVHLLVFLREKCNFRTRESKENVKISKVAPIYMPSGGRQRLKGIILVVFENRATMVIEKKKTKLGKGSG